MIRMIKTFASFSFGCRVNQAEKEMLGRQLSEIGYQYSEDKPSIFIINTCAVTRKAEREARQLIYQTVRKWKNTRIVVTGCAATKWINEGIKVKGVDWVIDNTNKEYIAQLLSSKFKAQSSKLQVKSNNYEVNSKISILENDLSQHDIHIYKEGTNWRRTDTTRKMVRSEKLDIEDLPIDKFLNSKRLMLKIQDGCQRFCTFCIVPYLRGQPRSERIKNLVLRIKNYEKDIKEVILTAINTQAFGYDTSETFTDLIHTILKETNIERLSFGSVHPWSINGEFIKLYDKYKDNDRLVKFLHIPLQSGSNKILTLMKRGYTREEFIEKLHKLQKIYPLTFFGTDIITGFLEETDRDFQDTYNFLKDSPISRFHVFRFSRREKTAAFFMAKNLKEPTPTQKATRAKALLELSNKKYQQFLEKHIGKSFPALFLEKRIDDYQEALLNNQIPTMIKTRKDLTGRIREVKIRKLLSKELSGTLVLGLALIRMDGFHSIPSLISDII